MNQTARLAPVLAHPSSTSRAVAPPLLALDQVSLELGGKQILADLSLGLQPGEFLSVVGSSGCGKTSMLRVMAGLYQPTQGRATFEGAALTHPRAEIAIVFQDYAKALLPWRTVAGNVGLPLEATRLSRSDRHAQVESLLEKVGLAAHAEKYPGQLSGGMQQRVQIARALAQHPKVLLMDEPFGALDAITRRSLQDELLRLTAESNLTVLFVTHDLEEAIYLGDRIVTLKPNPGRIAHQHAVDLPRPRDHVTTPEQPAFQRLRRVLFDQIEEGHA